MAVRRQLTLLVPREVAAPLEAVRRLVDPVQAALIPAHVTLCREDELEGRWPAVAARLRATPPPVLELRFGPPEPFDGHGLWLPCRDGEPAYLALRRTVLADPDARPARPHLTLAHPRNPRAPGNVAGAGAALAAGLAVRFDEVSLVEQETGAPWRVVERFRCEG